MNSPAPRADVATALSAIDHVIGTCQYPPCGRPLNDSPSGDFCSEDCQHAWHDHRAGSAPAGGTATPDESVTETSPVRPLSWLGPPPPGAFVRPGHEVLDAVCAFISRFNAFPSEHCAPTLALWYAHTHVADRFYVTPRLVLSSAEPGSGKTRVLEVAQFLVRAPEMTFSASTAALYRMVGAGPLTILFDEVDAIFDGKGGNEDLRALLNAGYKRSATVARCKGDASRMEVERFPVYAPAALAGIAGSMPDTITTRAVTIHMRRRRHDEHVDQFRERAVAREAKPIRTELAAWMASIGDQVSSAEPDMPDGVSDRPAEIWEPLLAIADAAGGHWPTTARAACLHFVHDNGSNEISLGIRLLGDLRTLFTEHDVTRMGSAEIVHELCNLEESPWADLHGKPLDARRLAKELTRYSVKPTAYKDGPKTVKGYQVTGPTGLADAWARYLPAATATHGREQ